GPTDFAPRAEHRYPDRWTEASIVVRELYAGCEGGTGGVGKGLRSGTRSSLRRTFRTINIGMSSRRAIWSCIGPNANWVSRHSEEAPRTSRSYPFASSTT